MTDRQLLELLNDALKANAPQAYSQMQANGMLAAWLNNLAATTQDAIGEGRNSAVDSLVSMSSPTFEANPLARTQAINMAAKEAQAQALEQAMEAIRALAADPKEDDAA